LSRLAPKRREELEGGLSGQGQIIAPEKKDPQSLRY